MCQSKGTGNDRFRCGFTSILVIVNLLVFVWIWEYIVLSSKSKYGNCESAHLNISIICDCEIIVSVRLDSFIVGGSLITSYVPIGPNVLKLWYIKVVTVTEEFDVVY